MSTQNTWSIIGRIGQDAEIKQSKNGQLLVFSVAVDRSYYDKNKSERVEKTQWLDVLKNIPAGQNDKHAQYLKKGCLVQVEGVPFPSGWVDKEGQAQVKQSLSAKSVKSLTWPDEQAKTQTKSSQPVSSNDNDLPY